MMSNEPKNKKVSPLLPNKSLLLSPKVAAGALAGLGLIPGAAKAQSVLSASQSLEVPIEPPVDVDDAFDAQKIDPAAEVRSRDVEWDVPWLAPVPAEPISAEIWTPPTQLASAFAEEAAIAQAARTDYPLIAIAEDIPEEASLPKGETAPNAAPYSSEVVFSTEIVLASNNASDDDEIDAEATESEEAALAETFETVVPLLALNEVGNETGREADDSEEETAGTANPLLALADADEKDFETVSPLLAISAPIEAAATSPVRKTPWVASSLAAQDNFVETGADLAPNPQLALSTLVESGEIEKPSGDWIALADDEDDDDDAPETDSRIALLGPEEDGKRTPWLARGQRPSGGSAANSTPNNTSNVSGGRPSTPRLAVLPSRNRNKRPSDWVSLTPIDFIEQENEDIALNPNVPQAAQTYDITSLARVSITPADLAQAGEVAVSVSSDQVEFLSPEAGAFLDIPATSVVLRFPIGANIALLSNGQVVDSGLVGRTETNAETELRTQTWYGVPLITGENILEVISTESGSVLQSLPLSVRGQPDRLVILSPRSIPADGRSTVPVRGQLVDEVGNLSRWDSVATLTTTDGRFLGADSDPDMPGYQVEIQRGEFLAELQSSLESNLVQIQARANGFEAYSQVQFETPQRASLLSGVIDVRLGARGTDFYDSYREFLPVDRDNSYELDVDAAVFATGNIGDWLYTGAYNSDRTLNENCQGESTLFASGSGTCTGYAIYGDDSSSDRITPSLDSVYLRFERNSPSNDLATDYAMWGDFSTQEFATSAQTFTSTSRQLHGLKLHYNFGNLAATALYANNVEGFQRDIIAPDGTSGTYFTSERDIVPGSETVFFELEELERPGTVLERTPLARGTDYEVDYDRGTLLFREPVARTSVDDFGQLLVRRIVASYQHEDGSDTDILAGRLQYGLSQQQGRESWVGTSYFNENQGERDFSLYGADTQIALGESAKLIAEVARSTNSFSPNSAEVSGGAYRVELNASMGPLSGRVHFRTTDSGFSNSATTSFVPGQTRYGAQIAGLIGNGTTIRAQYDHEDNFGVAPRIVTDASDLLTGISDTGVPSDNSLTTYSVGVGQRFGKISTEVDWIHRDRTDRNNRLADVTSDQIRSRLTYPIANNLTLVAQNELNLSSNVDPIYPSRTLIGLNWQAMPWLNVGLNQIFYGGGGNDRGSSTSLDVSSEHTFASDTTVRGRFSSVDGRQLGGSIGVEQGINLAPGLNLDLGYEKIFNTFGNQTAASTQVSQSVVSGSNASALGLSGGESYSIGLSYTDSADFQGSTRFEHRNSTGGSNTVFSASAVGRLSPAFSILGDYRLNNSANRGVNRLSNSSTLKLGLAYRNPEDDRFNALLRYEHRRNPNSLPSNSQLGTSTNTQEHVFSTEAIYAPDWRWELYGKYALRNSSTSITTNDNDFSSDSLVQLAQARATYRLGYRWDVVGEARWVGSNDYSETGYALEAGYYPLPDLRMSAGYSGGANDSDFGNNRSAGGFYVGVTAKLGGLFSGFGTQPIAPAQEQESVIEVRDDASSPQATLDLSSLRVEDSPEASEAANPSLPTSSPIPTFDASALGRKSMSEPTALDAFVKKARVNESFPTAVEL